jgi:hypothetical protein
VIVVVGIAWGLLTAWVFRCTVNAPALRAAFRRIHASFLEFRLFFDEPRLIWRAQKALIRANLRVCLLLLPPTLILAPPTAWLMLQLDAAYGVAPLRVGQPALVTAKLLSDSQEANLDAPPGIDIEAPPVHITGDREIAWRIVPTRAVIGNLRFKIGGLEITKTIAACDRPIFLLRGRGRSLWLFLLHPEEPRIPPGAVEWLDVDYPHASRWWIVWFVGISSTTAALFALISPPAPLCNSEGRRRELRDKTCA